MTFEFHKLSELIHKYGDSQSISRIVNRNEPPLQPDQEGIFQYCLAKGPDKALKNMAGTTPRLEDICEELDIFIAKDKLDDEEHLRLQILQNLSGVPDFRELEINAFSVIKKRVDKLMSSDEDIFWKVFETVVDFEFLVRQSFDLITSYEILISLNPYLQDTVNQTKESKSFGRMISHMKKVNRLIRRINENQPPPSEERKNSFSNNLPFPGINFRRIFRLTSTRGEIFAHKSKYSRLSDGEKKESIARVLNLLDPLCTQFQKITPPIIVQIQYVKDHYGRDRIYYLEEKDFNEYGHLNDIIKQKRSKNEIWEQDYPFYCTTPYNPTQIRLFVPAYCRFESNKPLIQPNLTFTTDTIALDKISIKEEITND